MVGWCHSNCCVPQPWIRHDWRIQAVGRGGVWESVGWRMKFHQSSSSRCTWDVWPDMARDMARFHEIPIVFILCPPFFVIFCGQICDLSDHILPSGKRHGSAFLQLTQRQTHMFNYAKSNTFFDKFFSIFWRDAAGCWKWALYLVVPSRICLLYHKFMLAQLKSLPSSSFPSSAGGWSDHFVSSFRWTKNTLWTNTKLLQNCWYHDRSC